MCGISLQTQRFAALVGLVAALSCPGVGKAQGDSSHYQTLQLGERSRGMGAAYTGFAADGAAIWYNPAGLPLLEPKLLQGSLSLIQIRKVNIQGAIISDGPDGEGGEDQVDDFSLKSNPALPGFAVASFAVGKPKEALDNRKPVQIAISAFVLYSLSTGGDINFQDNLGRTNSLQFYQEDRRSYFAVAVGHRPTKRVSWGITLLAGRREVQHVETLSLARGGTQDPTKGSPCPSSPTLPFCILEARQFSRNTVFRMDNWDLSARIGLMNLIGDRWRVGLMFQTPGVRVGGKSDLRFELSDVRPITNPDNPGLSDSVFANIQRDSRSPLPWVLRLGASYVISRKVVVAADLQLVGPVAGGSIAPGIPQLEGRADTRGLLLADSTERVFTWNISLGSEIQINRFLFTRFGFLTDNSGAPSASGTTSFIRPAEVDRYGFSASLGGFKNQKGLSVGVSMLFGHGTGNGLDVRTEAFADQQNFTRTSITERIIIVSVGGDIGQTANVVKSKVKEKKKQQEAAESEQARDIRAREGELGDEEDPEIRAAKQRAIDARKEALDADIKVREADEEVEELIRKSKGESNLDEEDQEALQESTVGGINTLR